MIMKIKDFVEMNEKFGFTNHFNEDVNVYIDDDNESAEFFNLFNSMEKKPDFFVIKHMDKYLLYNHLVNIKQFNEDVEVADIYRYLIRYMNGIK